RVALCSILWERIDEVYSTRNELPPSQEESGGEGGQQGGQERCEDDPRGALGQRDERVGRGLARRDLVRRHRRGGPVERFQGRVGRLRGTGRGRGRCRRSRGRGDVEGPGSIARQQGAQRPGHLGGGLEAVLGSPGQEFLQHLDQGRRQVRT